MRIVFSINQPVGQLHTILQCMIVHTWPQLHSVVFYIQFDSLFSACVFVLASLIDRFEKIPGQGAMRLYCDAVSFIVLSLCLCACLVYRIDLKRSRTRRCAGIVMHLYSIHPSRLGFCRLLCYQLDACLLVIASIEIDSFLWDQTNLVSKYLTSQKYSVTSPCCFYCNRRQNT